LPEILLPTPRGLLAVLEAYFDESERAGGVFCVAGYVFERASAKKFDREWRTLLGARWPFHMVDLVAGRGRFADLSRRECDRLLRAVVALINHRIVLGVAVSCRIDEVNSVAPKWIRGFGHPYTLCCHLCMASVGTWVRETGRVQRVAYVFESGYQAVGEAQDFLRGASRDPEGPEFYQYYSHGFVPKKDSSHLQSADLLAWEWAKCYDETIDMDLRPVRRSLQALIKPNRQRYKVVHLTGLPLRRFMREIEQMELHQLRGESG
jgi:hypothetical protein